VKRTALPATFFSSPAAFRAWFERHHASSSELLVGFYKRGSGKPSITWPESVDQALCFGWIDGVRRSIDHESYSIRFTPRRAGSNWSTINVNRVKELSASGLMSEAGLEAFRRRLENKSGIYSYEQRHSAKLTRADESRFKANKKAWAFFQAQPPWYRRTATHWVVSAKKEETQKRRLLTLISDSAKGRTIGPLTRPGRQS
jgi:uncharacterized protein YdeI (YjbR/CyaY-like superfamily)